MYVARGGEGGKIEGEGGEGGSCMAWVDERKGRRDGESSAHTHILMQVVEEERRKRSNQEKPTTR